ncbi:MAG: prolyl oligopeptidase family serine peptidase [Planctomycetota bacterium]
MNRLSAAMAAIALFAVPGLAQDRLSPELLWELRRVSGPQPSPDGRHLLYGVRTYDLEANRGTSHLWLQDLQNGERRALTSAGSNFNARWSSDGRTIAFLSTRDGAPQIYTIRVDGGEAQQVTDVEGGVSNMAWSPTGTHFSFTAAVKLDQTVHDLHPDLPKAEAKLYDTAMFRHWDEWKDGTYSHLFVVAAEGGEPRDLMAGERFDTPVKPFGGGEQIAWSPDGKELCYTAKKIGVPIEWAQSTDNDLYAVSVDGGAARNLTEGMEGYDQEPVYSPDGRWIAFHSMARAGFESDRNRIMLLDRQKGGIRELTTDFDQSTHSATWAPDSESLYFTSDIDGTTQIYRLGLGGGAPMAISAGRFQFAAPSPGPTGQWLYCLRQSTERPFEVVRLATGGAAGQGEALTDENGGMFAKLELPRVESREFATTDGAKVHAWVVYPPNFDPNKKWPMLLYCQGGPQSQVGQWFSYRWNFHLMAAQGYVVLAPNRRGLPGFGQAWNDQISRDWGGQAMDDLLACTDAMRQESFIDRERVAAIGASFGGYSVYWLMGHDQENRFCAMLAHCGVFNLESMYLSTEELFFVNWDLGGPYWEVPDDYQRFSPHLFAKEWDTPLFVIHGEKDFRVPVAQGIQAFNLAQVQGVPSRFLYFPEEGHWVLSPQNGVVWHREFFRFLGEWCKPGDAAAARPQTAAASVRAGTKSQPVAGAEGADRQWLLERVDDTSVVQLYADGFESLSLRDKMLCYHLAQAAIAGRDIFIDQKFEHALEIRDLLEELFVHRRALEPATRAEIDRYTKLFWVHNGIHSGITSRKELLQLDEPAFARAIQSATAAGASVPNPARARVLWSIMTDPESHQSCTDKTPGEGEDALQASCNNLYRGVSLADLEKFEERNPLNSRVVKLADGSLVEQVYRAGDGDRVLPGLYAKELTEVIAHLEAAIPFAPEKTQRVLDLLVRYYRTGDPADWRACNIAWVQDTDSVVDQINGFIEVYLDARGQKGAWEAVVSFLNPAKTKTIQALAEEAQWFEDRMPWPEEFKKKNVKGISARAISVITETGDSGPITPIGINLPNEADIRQDYGSKSVNLANVVEAYDAARGASGSLAEFAWSEEEQSRAKKWASLAGDTLTNLHEVVGHASGQLEEGNTNPAGRLGMFYSTLEEGRADLVGLYWIADPKLQEMGIVPHPDVALAEYEGYARNGLVQLRRVAIGDRIEEDHMRNRQMVVHWLIANTDAIAVEKRAGKTFYRVTSAAAFRKGCGTLLAEVMRIKATGDFEAGKKLVETYGTNVDRALHEEVLARIAALDLPSATGFVQPELRLVHDDQGGVVDVEVHYPMDLAAQMLRFSGRR